MYYLLRGGAMSLGDLGPHLLAPVTPGPGEYSVVISIVLCSTLQYSAVLCRYLEYSMVVLSTPARLATLQPSLAVVSVVVRGRVMVTRWGSPPSSSPARPSPTLLVARQL